MRRIIREDILGESYRCHQYLGKHGNVKKSEGQDYVDNNHEEENNESENKLTNKDSNSEVTLSIRHGKENIVIHTDKEIVGESAEIKHDYGTSVNNISEDTRNVPFYFLQNPPSKRRRSWEPDLSNLVTHNKFMYIINRVNRDGSDRWTCKMERKPYHCLGNATTYKDNSGEVNG